MTSINKLDRALTTLRKTLEQKQGIQQGAVENRAAAEAGQAARSERNAQIQRRIRERLAPLDLDHPEDQKKGAAIFLETVLANEFGTELMQDPAFHDLLVDVRNTMFADRLTQKDLVSMLVQIKDSNPG